MRVLLTCVIGHGHFHPMVPLAQALEEAGHQVAVATDPSFCGYVRDAGFEAHPAGLDHPEALARFIAATPAWAETPPQDRMPLQFPGLFAGVRAPVMLRDLQPLIATWRPDLVIHETAEMAGAIAAEEAGVAHVEHSFGILRPAIVREVAVEILAPIADRLGVTNPGVSGSNGELYLDICPPGIQQPEIAAVPNVQPLRPVGFDAGRVAGLPSWIADLPAQPTIYVTMGTVFNKSADVFGTVLEGLQDEDVNVIVTVGETGDPALLGPQSDNVHIERFIPQSQLLPHCDLLVSHAGSGAMVGALAAGVPMLAVPQGADQFVNADAIVRFGAGLRLLPAELTAVAVRDATRQLLTDPGFADVARAEQAAIREMPSPESVVPLLETLVSESHDRYAGSTRRSSQP
jgi:UDP:flavonoid glycosyltransferase YjiC (YdhE family)